MKTIDRIKAATEDYRNARAEIKTRVANAVSVVQQNRQVQKGKLSQKRTQAL